MTDREVADNARLPIALAVATGHETRIVQRALVASSAKECHRDQFEVVQVGVGCCDIDSDHMLGAYSAIVSTGFAGALDPDIASGSLLFPELVRKADNTTYPVDRELQQTITMNSPTEPVTGALLHTDQLLVTSTQKENACKDYQCIACDMESASLAATAKQGGQAFACLRIVLDPVKTPIPASIVDLTTTHTDPSASAFLNAVWRHPGQWAAIAAFLWHSFKASRALSRSVQQLTLSACE